MRGRVRSLYERVTARRFGVKPHTAFRAASKSWLEESFVARNSRSTRLSTWTGRTALPSRSRGQRPPSVRALEGWPVRSRSSIQYTYQLRSIRRQPDGYTNPIGTDAHGRK